MAKPDLVDQATDLIQEAEKLLELKEVTEFRDEQEDSEYAVGEFIYENYFARFARR